ncbi:huntingtin-interacting protein K [Galendromus occidentalis]|uniref:Huntingtin-interacting protein K n=1 Tax=Galendromus occidentalis TaxID=34638 RepID=A0AAJ6QSK0_9ACAR|nr:huntingtin-interacting protein K [Galendromus occidentalis]
MPQKEAPADEESQQKKIAKHDASNAADLEKVTDFHEEQELSGGDLETALKAITEKRNKEVQKRVEHLKKLAAVKINKEDVELIMRELEIPRLKAETCLRQAYGDVVQALLDLIDN